MWPLVSVYAQNAIKTTLEPMVVESLREYKINSFAFDKLRLGSIVSNRFPEFSNYLTFITNVSFRLHSSHQKLEVLKYMTKYHVIK